MKTTYKFLTKQVISIVTGTIIAFNVSAYQNPQYITKNSPKEIFDKARTVIGLKVYNSNNPNIYGLCTGIAVKGINTPILIITAAHCFDKADFNKIDLYNKDNGKFASNISYSYDNSSISRQIDLYIPDDYKQSIRYTKLKNPFLFSNGTDVAIIKPRQQLQPTIKSSVSFANIDDSFFTEQAFKNTQQIIPFNSYNLVAFGWGSKKRPGDSGKDVYHINPTQIITPQTVGFLNNLTILEQSKIPYNGFNSSDKVNSNVIRTNPLSQPALVGEPGDSGGPVFICTNIPKCMLVGIAAAVGNNDTYFTMYANPNVQALMKGIPEF